VPQLRMCGATSQIAHVCLL